MAPDLYPHTPYCLDRNNGGIHLALASVGALPANDQAWAPFARNNTPYRNIVLVRQDADSELRYLANDPTINFNPYGFATVGTVLDCQRLSLYTMPEMMQSELGFAWPDSRDIVNIRDDSYERKITARHLIIRKNIPAKVNSVRNWGRIRRYGHCNYDTDTIDP
ncbi:MAG: hypothetical protein Q9169_003990 [Polycauliona sp. 2 TL-2023]